ncbi:hypothetical protein [Mucilaginibacter arboris]|uniref:Uncharacterized protein n=1 Tax=Mucilaginibacter arboris TaxID=2682090 RepID=A0A7K1ST75_9SPHI|nr:hypothetical protein [Mucilaginibacter arboris]MVN20509.1 hypothetical protein [Mucilaginibacter arboris]
MKALKAIFFFMLMLISPITFAHVGSPGVVYEGKAGPYNIMVNINPPDVIPGTASVSIYTENQQVKTVLVSPVYWYAGDKGSPKADEALPVKGTPGQYQATVWLMWTGTSSMKITVNGVLGKGTAVVPVMAVSTAQRTMPKSLGWILVGLGLLLVILMATIIGASVSDGLLKPGTNNLPHLQRKKITGFAVSLLVLALILYGGSSWWNSWSRNYRRNLYFAPQAKSSILNYDQHQILHFQIDSNSLKPYNKSMSFIVPDHGKLMHLFMVRENSLDVFAHLHPFRKDSLNFFVDLPDLPEGRYLVFADVVRWNGFTETITDTLDVPQKTLVKTASAKLYSAFFPDPDDTYVISNTSNQTVNNFAGKTVLLCGSPGESMKLADGSSAVWEHAANVPFEANKVYPLTFAIHDPSGAAVKLEPYMGMMGHAVVLKYDGSVYMHLHPVGTFSMASQEIIEGRMKGSEKPPATPDAARFRDSIDREIIKIRQMSESDRNKYLAAAMPVMDMQNNQHSKMDAMVTFPYAFPSAGKYRIWVQMKRNGKILNSAFDAIVQ